MKYSKKEYEKMPLDDAYITGIKPEVIRKIRSTIDQVKTIQYLLEEVIVGAEETILKARKL